VLARVKTQLRLKILADELRSIATIDALTGVANRRLFDQSFRREWRRTRRSCDPMALLMIDIDHFKSYNDRYGHPGGDSCLRAVAQALARAGARPADLVARYGGDELVVLLPQTPRAGAEHMAQALLDAVEALCLRHEGSVISANVTISMGVACYDEHSPWWAALPVDSRFAELQHDPGHGNAADLLRAADVALYAAKRAGRAQAWLVDIADVDVPLRARPIASSPRTLRGASNAPHGQP